MLFAPSKVRKGGAFSNGGFTEFRMEYSLSNKSLPDSEWVITWTGPSRNLNQKNSSNIPPMYNLSKIPIRQPYWGVFLKI